MYSNKMLGELPPPNTACTGQVRAFRRTFRESGPNGGFGLWWLYPPHPALAGNACR